MAFENEKHTRQPYPKRHSRETGEHLIGQTRSGDWVRAGRLRGGAGTECVITMRAMIEFGEGGVVWDCHDIFTTHRNQCT